MAAGRTQSSDVRIAHVGTRTGCEKNMQVQQCIALVTAATGGIGLGIAKALLDAGHCVVISGRDPQKGERVATELDPAGRAGAAGLRRGRDVFRRGPIWRPRGGRGA